MLKQIRQTLINNLWDDYYVKTTQMQIIKNNLTQKNLRSLFIDHFAIIDLPGPNTGIPYLSQIFSALGYLIQGNDYLHNKQNDFTWMREADCLNLPVTEVLPQVVVADFRLDELPANIKKIILKYALQAKPAPLTEIKKLVADIVSRHDAKKSEQLISMIKNYLSGRDWPLPTMQEFFTVHEFNELLAWVLVFGRRPNHFTLSIHLLSGFNDLDQFNQYIEKELGIPLNRDGGMIKGGEQAGIAQSSTIGLEQKIQLNDGDVNLRTEFVEFVWRYPLVTSQIQPEKMLWKDFFTGFVAQHANYVIESLYERAT